MKEGEMPLRKLASLSGVSILNCLDKNDELLAPGMFACPTIQPITFGGAIRPGLPDEGAMSALMWQAILESQEVGCNVFDFEGP
ncbi:MAG: hypothetical protein R3B47_20650 [Bacteroidia bacterium]